MSAVASYIGSVIAASLVVGIVSAMAGSGGTAGALVKLVGGLYLTVTVLSPFVGFRLERIPDYFSSISAEASLQAQTGEELSRSAMGDIIKAESEAYILDTAESHNAVLYPEIILSQDEIPVPESVILRGEVSAVVRSAITDRIELDLGIPKENQTWIGEP